MAPRNPGPAFFHFRAVWRFMAVFALAAGLAGCASVSPKTDPVMDKKARRMAEQARDVNSEITTGKGTGQMTLTTPNRQERFKMAWAAGAPNRLRLTLLMSGHPVETIAATGEWVTFISHTGRHKPHSAVSADPDLEPYIDIPIRLSEMVALLLGKVPVRPFDRAWISPDDPDTILTAKSFSGTLQAIRFTPQGRVDRYRLLDTDRTLIYGVDYTAFRETNEHTIPTAITIADSHGRTLDITLSVVLPNAEVKESVFRLTGSGS
ncbi:MAG: hypothetical protein V6Z89_06225 [Desulfobacter sp.]